MIRKISVRVLFVFLVSLLFSGAIFTLPAYPDDLFEMVGFATLNGGTTGGTGGKEVLAVNVSQVNDLLNQRKKDDDTSPLVIKFESKISGSEVIAVKEVSNITFIGVGNKGELEGVGINVVKSQNIIIRNLKIHHTKAPMDGIGMENSKNVWVDHCEIYNMVGDCNGDGIVDTKGDISGGDVDWFDGLLDIKRSSEYITVSWTYFHDAFKTSLIGASDSDTYDRKITFHHNIYSNVNSRLPSYRGGTGHIFNNYYVDVESSAINSRMGAKLRIENNVFENVGSGSMDDTGFAQGPIGAYYSDTIGYWDVKGNIYVNCKGNQPTESTCSFIPPYNYANVLNTPDQVKSIVLNYAGVGKIEGSTTPISILPKATPQQTITPTITNLPNAEIKYGDLNGDLMVNSTDYALMRRFILNIVELTREQLVHADGNLDGSVNSTDYSLIRRYILGVIGTLPYNPGGTQPTQQPQPTLQPTPTRIVTATTKPLPTPSSTTPVSGDIILQPNGAMSLQQAIETLQPGKTIYLKGGTYTYSSTIIIAEANNGTSENRKKISSYENEKPILDFSPMEWGSSNRGMILSGNYWNVKGLKFQNAGDNGMLLSGHNNIIDSCEFYANGDTGLQLSRYNSSYNSISQWPSNNIVQDCYSHSNYDKDNGEDADGFAAKLTSGQGNKFIRCVAKYNVDDGWDLYTKSDTGPIGSVYFEDCEASYNGKTESGQSTEDSDGNGFKLGGSKISVDHTLVNCKAFNNKKHGFTWNSNPGKLSLTGCSASGNGGNDFEKVTNN